MIFTVSADDLLIFTDTASSSIKAEAPEDTISFADGVFSNFKYSQIIDTLSFTSILNTVGVHNVTISDALSFSESVLPRVLVVTINDFLFLWDFLGMPIGGVIRETLGFSESLIMYKGPTLDTDTMTFSDSLSLQLIGSKRPSDTLTLSDGLSFVLLNRSTLDVPAGYVPETQGLTVAFTDITETMTLSNPDFNDTDTIVYKRLNKTTRGYTPIIVGIAGWAHKKAKKMTFSFLKELEANHVKAFWSRNHGTPVTLTDMYGTVYTVILQNPEFEVAQVGRENRTLTLDLYVL